MTWAYMPLPYLGLDLDLSIADNVSSYYPWNNRAGQGNAYKSLIVNTCVCPSRRAPSRQRGPSGSSSGSGLAGTCTDCAGNAGYHWYDNYTTWGLLLNRGDNQVIDLENLGP